MSSPGIRAVLAGKYLRKSRDEISSSGYVVDTLEAALWAFAHADDFATGALLAVNLGNDADTVGAVYGQLAGAYFGFTGIPTEWTSQVHDVDMLINTATALHDLVPEMRVSDESAVHLHECLL